MAVALVCVSALCLDGCAGYMSDKPSELVSEQQPMREAARYKERGTASYYTKRFDNRKTASGEPLNNRAMTAAHRTLAFGTGVIVKNLDNGKSVTIRINDRGPFVKGRIIDLTRAAFARIASLDDGLAKVEIRIAI
jgi:rare lipoprotein A